MQIASTITDVAETVLSVAGALGVVLTSTWAIAKYTLSRELMPSLRSHKDEFKAWNSELFAHELQRSANSAHAIESIETTLGQLAEEMGAIRRSLLKHDETLISLPGILTSLNNTLERHARTDDKLGTVLDQMGKDVSETKIHIAHIMGKLSMEPRRTSDAPTVSTR